MADKYLTPAAARLARAAPNEWKTFLEAIHNYAEARIVECVQSPSDTLHIAQGRAQNALHLWQTLASSLADADKMERK